MFMKDREPLVLAPLSPEAQKLYDAIRAKGYEPHGLDEPADLRDAAHEAHHALFCNLRSPWTRDRIQLLKPVYKRGEIREDISWLIVDRAHQEMREAWLAAEMRS